MPLHLQLPFCPLACDWLKRTTQNKARHGLPFAHCRIVRSGSEELLVVLGKSGSIRYNQILDPVAVKMCHGFYFKKLSATLNWKVQKRKATSPLSELYHILLLLGAHGPPYNVVWRSMRVQKHDSFGYFEYQWTPPQLLGKAARHADMVSASWHSVCKLAFVCKRNEPPKTSKAWSAICSLLHCSVWIWRTDSGAWQKWQHPVILATQWGCLEQLNPVAVQTRHGFRCVPKNGEVWHHFCVSGIFLVSKSVPFFWTHGTFTIC